LGGMQAALDDLLALQQLCRSRPAGQRVSGRGWACVWVWGGWVTWLCVCVGGV